MTDKSTITLITMAVLMLGAVAAQAQTFTVLYKFTGGSDGGVPSAVIQDPAGNLYGTTPYGGDLNCGSGSGCGVVFEVNTAGNETVLHTFSGSPDGMQPYAPAIRDNAGNIYGTTWKGGSTYGYCSFNGCGTVFKIDTAGEETVLYSFTDGSDGCFPEQGLFMDKTGNLYGTTTFCPTAKGTIFKLDSAGNFSVLHTWPGWYVDPWFGHLRMDNLGNLYGLTVYGGVHSAGGLYKLSKSGKFTLLHSFAGGTSDGCNPYGSVGLDNAGNIYGTTQSCGSYNEGTIWKVDTTGKETILHNFVGGTSDGCSPEGGVIHDSKGNLYGVAAGCGADNYGVLYELSASGAFTLLHSFDGSDGSAPGGEVWRAGSGTLFGTAMYGGTGNCYPGGGQGCGTVWSYVP